MKPGGTVLVSVEQRPGNQRFIVLVNEGGREVSKVNLEGPIRSSLATQALQDLPIDTLTPGQPRKLLAAFSKSRPAKVNSLVTWQEWEGELHSLEVTLDLRG